MNFLRGQDDFSRLVINQSACGIYLSHIIMNNIIEPESGVTTLNSIVENCEQCGQHNIVQSCLFQYCNKLMIFFRLLRVTIKLRVFFLTIACAPFIAAAHSRTAPHTLDNLI